MTLPKGNDFSCLSSFRQHVSAVTASSLDYAGMASNSIKLLTGNSHPDLAKAVAARCVLLSRTHADNVWNRKDRS